MIRETLGNIVLILTMRCDQASRLISHSQERQLNRAERCALSLHLLICRMCRKYKRQLALMRDVLSRLKEPDLYYKIGAAVLDKGQSADMRTRISKKIRQELDST